MSVASDMITQIHTAMAKGLGVSKIRYADGREVTYDRKQLMAELNFWRGQASAESTGGLVLTQLNLKGDA